MSNAREFVKKLSENADFRQQFDLSVGVNAGQIRARAGALGYNFSDEELTAELSSADLTGIVGGVGSASGKGVRM
ncbi:MAG: Nif11-like leader peptide family RiPP precursor [Pseudomonadota bacterium]